MLCTSFEAWLHEVVRETMWDSLLGFAWGEKTPFVYFKTGIAWDYLP
jgi:hypothetical protein